MSDYRRVASCVLTSEVMPQSSAVTLLGILQSHGLTLDVLEDMVTFCECHRTGSITLHIAQGKISAIEDCSKRKVCVSA